jgi:hypothetical protein
MTPRSLVAWVDLSLGVATISLFLYLMISPWMRGRRLDVSRRQHPSSVVSVSGLISPDFAVWQVERI